MCVSFFCLITCSVVFILLIYNIDFLVVICFVFLGGFFFFFFLGGGGGGGGGGKVICSTDFSCLKILLICSPDPITEINWF